MARLFVKDLLSDLTARFEQGGIDDARGDARALVAFVLKKEPIYLRMNPDLEIEPGDLEIVEEYARRRLKREPVSKITQTRGFWRLDFKVTPDVLDPRPDSETVIEEVLSFFKDKSAPLKILDLGTGSGCLAQALLCEYYRAEAVGVDVSQEALAVALENAATNGLKDRFKAVLKDWNQPGWTDGLENGFDVVVSNPPYIALGERADLAPEVVDYDPPQALFAGSDGLDAYRKIAPALSALLKSGGLFVCEFGKGQEESVRRIICANGLIFHSFGVDFGGVTRCLSAFLQNRTIDVKKD